MNESKYAISHILMYSWIAKMIPLIIYDHPIFLDGSIFGLFGLVFGAIWDLRHAVKTWDDFFLINKKNILIGGILTLLAAINTI